MLNPEEHVSPTIPYANHIVVSAPPDTDFEVCIGSMKACQSLHQQSNCPVCNGQGEFRDDWFDGKKWHTVITKCLFCNGTGFIIVDSAKQSNYVDALPCNVINERKDDEETEKGSHRP